MKVEDKKKICNKIFGRIFMALLIAFMAIYLSSQTGYYNFELHNRTVLTEEKIKEFEQDVENGKNIDIKDYVVSFVPSYENSVSKLGNKLSVSIESVIKTGIDSSFKFLNKMLGG